MTVFRRRLHDSYYQSYAKMVSLSIRNVFTLQYICEQKSVRIILSCLTLTLQRYVGQVDVNSGFSTVTFKMMCIQLNLLDLKILVQIETCYCGSFKKFCMDQVTCMLNRKPFSHWGWCFLTRYYPLQKYIG